MYKLTKARTEGKEIPRRSDFQRVACELQTFDPLYREKVAEVLQDFEKSGAYHIINGVLFFQD